MSKLIKPASLLLYFLAFIVFSILGMIIAGWSGAGEGQGLAAGAIVVGYGVMTGFFALIASLFVAYNSRHQLVVTLNKVMGVVFGIFMIALAVRIVTKQRQADSTSAVVTSLARLASLEMEADPDMPLGLGFFTPDFYEQPVLYFYNNPNQERSVRDHAPTDSIVFKRSQHGGFEITSAPLWLAPDHMKLDYDMLYFRVRSIGWEFAEVIVNNHTLQTSYIHLSAGKITYWPEFLLGVHSVEFYPGSMEKVRIKPMSHASEVTTSFDFMRPMVVRENWMYVELQDQDFKPVGKGWIQWKREGKLLILYSLLS